MTDKNTIGQHVAQVTTEYSAFKWTIPNFHFCEGTCCNNMSITSPEFITNNLSNAEQQTHEIVWTLKLSGPKNMQGHRYLLVELDWKRIENIDTTINIRLSFLNAQNIKVFQGNGKVSGLKYGKCGINFIDTIYASKCNQIAQGRLSLLCEFDTNQIKRKRIDDRLESLSNDLGTCLEDKNTSDVVVVVGNEKFYVHKLILMSRSPVFRAMFENDMKEKRENTVNISNFDSKVIEEMLRFIYTGKVKNICGFESMLLSAADQYELESLKITCANILCKNLNAENACEMLALACQYKMTHFKNDVIDFISSNRDNIIAIKLEDLNVE